MHPTLGTYSHYKHGNLYELIGIAEQEEDGTEVAVYRAEYGNRQLYTRPLESFVEMVEKDGKTIQRFTLIS